MAWPRAVELQTQSEQRATRTTGATGHGYRDAPARKYLAPGPLHPLARHPSHREPTSPPAGPSLDDLSLPIAAQLAPIGAINTMPPGFVLRQASSPPIEHRTWTGPTYWIVAPIRPAGYS